MMWRAVLCCGLGAASAWACSGDESSTRDPRSGSAESSAESSSAAGGGKGFPCGTSKTCAIACCLISNEYGAQCTSPPEACPSTAFVKTECDGPSDCTAEQVCCGSYDTTFRTGCRAYCNDGEATFCNANSECETGSCKDVSWNGPTGYKSCQL